MSVPNVLAQPFRYYCGCPLDYFRTPGNFFLTNCNFITPLPIKNEPHYQLRGRVSSAVSTHQLIPRVAPNRLALAPSVARYPYYKCYLLPKIKWSTQTLQAWDSQIPTYWTCLAYPLRKYIKNYETLWRDKIQFKVNSWTVTLNAI
jgi:hypothetical protein